MVFWLGNLAWLWRLIGNGGPLPLVLLGHGASRLLRPLHGTLRTGRGRLWNHERIRNHRWLRVR